MSKHKSLTEKERIKYSNDFCSAIDLIYKNLGSRAFRPETSLNAAVFDSVMIGVFRRMRRGSIVNEEDILKQYNLLIKTRDFVEAFKRSTADENQLRTRVEIATSYFAKVV